MCKLLENCLHISELIRDLTIFLSTKATQYPVKRLRWSFLQKSKWLKARNFLYKKFNSSCLTRSKYSSDVFANVFFLRTFGQLSLVSLGAALIYAWQRKITKGKQLPHQQNHFACNCVTVFVTLPKVVYIKYFSLKHYFKSQSFVVTASMQIIYF